MKALVLGAGIVGITTAYELNRDGHEVTVIDREAEPAAFTSFSNAGLFAPGHAYAWSSPAAPKILLRSLWRGDQALRFKFSADPALLVVDVALLGAMHAGARGAQHHAQGEALQLFAGCLPRDGEAHGR